MSQWVEGMLSHQVFQEISDINKALDLAKDACLHEVTFVDHWDRASTVVKHIKSVLDQADPLLVVMGNLNNISSYLQQAKGEINNFASNKNAGHWSNAQTSLDNCLAQLPTIPRQSDTGIEDMKESAAGYRAAVAGWMDAIKKDGNGISEMQRTLQNRITEAIAEINTQKQRLDTAIATFQQQFSEAQQMRQTEFSTSEQARAQAATKSEQERQAEFDTIESERKVAAEKAAGDAAQRHTDLVTKLESDSKAIVDTMDKLKAHAQKVVGIISDTGMAHGYQKTANEERAEAAVWKKTAAWSLVVWIVIGVIFFLLTYDKDLTWEAVARQFLISTPFVLLAGFAAMQVSRHQKNERGLRQAELEIASLDPFLSTLEDNERNEVKKEFATRYFGQREVESKHESADPKLLDLAGSLARTLQEMQKAISK